MKKTFFLLLASLFAITGIEAQEIQLPNPSAPEITFEKEVIDYGTIEYASDGVREFKFKNTGKETLIISDVKTSCGCLAPEWRKDPIKPGETGSIKVRYDTKRAGSFEKTVTIQSNAKVPVKVLHVKGVVKPGMDPAPSEK